MAFASSGVNVPREPTSLCGLETAMQAHPSAQTHTDDSLNQTPRV